MTLPNLPTNSGLSIIIDWLQFTIKGNDVNTDTIIINTLLLDVNNFIQLDHGKMGYKSQLFYNNISVLYNGNDGMGTHVIISGQACRY